MKKYRDNNNSKSYRNNSSKSYRDNPFYIESEKTENGNNKIVNNGKEYYTLKQITNHNKCYAEDLRCKFSEDGIFIPYVTPSGGLMGYFKIDIECIKGVMEMLEEEKIMENLNRDHSKDIEDIFANLFGGSFGNNSKDNKDNKE